MRKRLLGLLALVAVVVGLMPLTALAHNFEVEGDCKGWILDLDGAWGAVEIRVGNTVIPADQIGAFRINDNVASRVERSFTVTWDKAPKGPGGNDVTVTHKATRSTDDCVDFDVVKACGSVSVIDWRNDTNLGYAVAFEEGAATYDFAANATFGGRAFPEDHNGGSVSVSYYVVGAEADFIKAPRTALPNFWDQSAASVEVDTNCQDDVIADPVFSSAPSDQVCEGFKLEDSESGSITLTAGANYSWDGSSQTGLAAGSYGPFTATAAEGFTFAGGKTFSTGEIVIGLTEYEGDCTEPTTTTTSSTTTSTTTTTSTLPPVTTSTSGPEELPFTGIEDFYLPTAIAMVAAGGLLLALSRRPEEDVA